MQGNQVVTGAKKYTLDLFIVIGLTPANRDEDIPKLFAKSKCEFGRLNDFIYVIF
ncbi:hypothetical protein D3C78_1773050 [compost metagenome]